MANQHEAKELLQEQIKASFIQTALSDRPYRMALYSSTGSGKSKASLDCANWYLENVQAGETLICCHSIPARDISWPEEIEKWAKNTMVQRDNRRVCYKSLPKINGQYFAVAIFDEAHYLTLNAESFFRFNEFGAIILLTATRPRDPDKRELITKLVLNNEFKLKVDTAVDRGITNDYRVHLFEIELDTRNRNVMLPYSSEVYTEAEAYMKWCLRIHEAKHPGNGKPNAKYIKHLYIDMMRWMGATESKTRAAKYIIDKFRANGRRFIVFASSKEQCKELGPYIMHSGTDQSDYVRFLNGEIDELITIKQIQEAANIFNLQRGLVLQIDSNPLNIVQKNGRLLRLELSQLSALNVIVFKGTFDEGWTIKAFKEFAKHKIIKHSLPQSQYWPNT